ncbi:hypothetical protein PoB_007338100 [Plakobranchus ocellatus]|uniref:Uncharacterized protein n=1 Tax=Plakobranchus ocellatus TaxID=259542 RepID=A0AAV4DSS8_9GAST|nr:hypothetical protein PoB_007338100 [Plakobranchus ocellatus]
MHRALTAASKNKLQDILTVCQLCGERKNRFRMWLLDVRKWQLTTCRLSYDPPEILWRQYKHAMRRQQTLRTFLRRAMQEARDRALALASIKKGLSNRASLAMPHGYFKF